jgi:hypothetical protein
MSEPRGELIRFDRVPVHHYFIYLGWTMQKTGKTRAYCDDSDERYTFNVSDKVFWIY